MRASRLVTAVAFTAALATSLAACGGDDSPGTGGSTAPTVAAADVKAGPPSGWSDGGWSPNLSALKCGQTAAEPTRGVTDTEIKIGGLGYLTSPTGSTMSGSDIGAKVRFQRANDEGGVNGRKINFIGMLDDGNDPARNGSQGQVLAQQEKIFAAVPVMASRANYLDAFCAATVPFFGWGFNTAFCGTSIGFGITGCLLPTEKSVSSNTYGLMLKGIFGGDVTGKTTALIGSDDDSARTGLQSLVRQIKAVGIEVPYAENPIPAAGLNDTTAIVNAVMTSDNGGPPDLILPVTDFSTTTKLTQAFVAAGYEGEFLNAVGYDPRLTGFDGLVGSYTLLQWSPAEDASSTAVQQLVADFKKYAPEQAVSLPTMAGYWAADMFLTAVEKLGRDVTVDRLLKLLNDDYSHYVEGALPETRYPLNHFIGAPCASVVQLTKGAYTVPTKLSCGQLLKQ
ncbi:ABC transporter substrate-binding protein [Frankia sp. CNm7]|uniref:ABC transporter substrate-binding protein n=1 Tax=Frankia nepalensis TaxID=1836974 RepID=A0A937UQH2_9ACTN|nr:ABC transporter substrate-binding protein [Frankia nepalensis]MBL7495311.1 ABC transporter substrate-binding protein [Frankia nepalensis]MBL7509690.1 ABC transporter substrate-binding protein [Frankia nepalensis]MBL7517625.1 ABC transporter substrate-binding protein [Frankia nepalensis]MBL7631844.1 ABC transporter substrate-binding protein [Frankia nepalensis]